MRQGLKRLIEVGASRSGVTSLLSRRMRGRCLVLAYHNVVPRGESAWGDGSLHLPQDVFRGHLDVLAECCTVRSLEEVVRASGGGGSARDEGDERPVVALTFDDAYRGAASAGVEELETFGFEATFFINPGLAAEPGFWWDRLAMDRGGTLPDSVREHGLEVLAGQQEEVLSWARAEGGRPPEAPDHARPSSEEGLRALAAQHNVSCECHTWSHPNLARITPAARATEFLRATRWMEEHLSRTPSFISYPYGEHDQAVNENAAAHPYRNAFRIEGGWMPAASRPPAPLPFALPRLNVPAGLSPEGLRLRLAGLGVAR